MFHNFCKNRVNANYDEFVNYGVKLEVIFIRKSDKSVTQLRNKLKKCKDYYWRDENWIELMIQ